jgi:glucose/arabinose dehydrogenase
VCVNAEGVKLVVPGVSCRDANQVHSRPFPFQLFSPTHLLPTSVSSHLPAIMVAATITLLAIASSFLPAWAQSSSCSTTLTPTNSVQPSVASGYRAQLIATGLSSPRSIKFDKAGNLLVVEQTNNGGSVSVLTLQDNGGTCLSVTSHTTLVTQSVWDFHSVGLYSTTLFSWFQRNFRHHSASYI